MSACSVGETGAEELTYIQTDAELVGVRGGTAGVDSLQAVCQGSRVIVKAAYLGYQAFSNLQNVHLFTVEEEFTDLIRDSVLHVYEGKETSFISGKTYYLFLNGFLSSFYPHTVYSRYAPAYLIGEDKDGYTFYDGKTLGLDTVADLSQYLRSEIIAKGLYNQDTALLEYESPESACAQAAVVLVATVGSVAASSSGNPYICYAGFTVDRVLKGEAPSAQGAPTEGLTDDVRSAASLDIPQQLLMQAPADTKVGEQFILLLKLDPESQLLDMFSHQNSCFPLDSEQARTILNQLD